MTPNHNATATKTTRGAGPAHARHSHSSRCRAHHRGNTTNNHRVPSTRTQSRGQIISPHPPSQDRIISQLVIGKTVRVLVSQNPALFNRPYRPVVRLMQDFTFRHHAGLRQQVVLSIAPCAPDFVACTVRLLVVRSVPLLAIIAEIGLAK